MVPLLFFNLLTRLPASARCPHCVERKWQPTVVFLPGESHGQRSLAGYGSWGRRELDTTEQRSVQRACVSTSPWAWAISGGTALQASGLGGGLPTPSHQSPMCPHKCPWQIRACCTEVTATTGLGAGVRGRCSGAADCWARPLPHGASLQ